MPPKYHRRKDNQRTESRSNLVGKFTTSVKKFVQEVESDGTREGAVQTCERLRNVTNKVYESYSTVKTALTTLHQQYEQSKADRNMFHKYKLFRNMIKAVIIYEEQYWLLVEIPKQEKQEQVTSYVLRACVTLEKASETRSDGKSQSLKVADEETREKERKARFDGLTIKEIEEESNQQVNELYRLLKKYSSLRNLIYELKIAYAEAKVYPIIPRYTMLKEMIKDVLRHPSYMEVCHEDTSYISAS